MPSQRVFRDQLDPIMSNSISGFSHDGHRRGAARTNQGINTRRRPREGDDGDRGNEARGGGAASRRRQRRRSNPLSAADDLQKEWKRMPHPLHVILRQAPERRGLIYFCYTFLAESGTAWKRQEAQDSEVLITLKRLSLLVKMMISGFKKVVARVGIEPTTRGFSVRCSTN
jgi:hypothetical protein